MKRVEESNLLATLAGQEPDSQQREAHELRVQRLRRAVKNLNSLSERISALSEENPALEVIRNHDVTVPQEREELFYNEAVLKLKRGTSLFEAFNAHEVSSDRLKSLLFKLAVRQEIKKQTLMQFFEKYGLKNEDQISSLVGTSDRAIANWMTNTASRIRARQSIAPECQDSKTGATLLKRGREPAKEDQHASKRVRRVAGKSPVTQYEPDAKYGANPFDGLTSAELSRLEKIATVIDPEPAAAATRNRLMERSKDNRGL